MWELEPDADYKRERIQLELDLILEHDFASYFIILASILDFCRDEGIPYGPGRGSVGGCLIAYLIGITEIDPLEYDLLFERFLNPERVSYPDVDIDVSQLHRPRVLEFIRDTYQHRGNVVLQVAAFARAGARSVIDHMVAAKRQEDPNADQIGYMLKDCLPEGNVTGGQKVPYELDWWLANGHGNKAKFRQIAEEQGWLDDMLKIDGLFTHLAKHAAGVVILSPEDLANLPTTGARDTATKTWHTMTGFDMYDLDDIGVLKIDLLGLRTLDVVSEAHKLLGGSGATRDLMQIWRNHRDDTEQFEQIYQQAETLGIFQMETDGYRRTLLEFQPTKFDHIVQLNALYRPGALDYRRPEDNKNMVEVFIDRHHGREPVAYLHPDLQPILGETLAIILYQEQAMRIARDLAGFSLAKADALRKAIGKKRQKEMDKLKPEFLSGCEQHGVPGPIANEIWDNIAAAARYSWNKSHAVAYAAITSLTSIFKTKYDGTGKPGCEVEGCPCKSTYGISAFYAALLNSYEDNKDRMAGTISEARQHAEISPPDINVAQEDFVIDEHRVIFGLNGVKGLGEATRNEILVERAIGGPFENYTDFAKRLPSVGTDKKLALIRAGAFDRTDSRAYLLATCRKSDKSDKTWTVAEHINHNNKLKKPREVPPPYELTFPTDRELHEGENEVVGFYLSAEPLAKVAQALRRCPKGNHYGGEIENIYKKKDRRGEEYCNITLLTPALTRQRVRVFASVYRRHRWLEKGMQILIRGRMDGDTVIADACFEPDDVRHFKKIRCERDGDPGQVEDFDGEIATVRDLENAGYTVHLL